MGRTAGKFTLIMIMVIGSIFVGTMFSYRNAPEDDTSQADFQVATVTPLATATETIPPNTPLPTLTPSQTLLEPPTATPTASPIPSQTPTATISVEVAIPGLNGAETPTPSTTPGCEPRKDWKLTYTVQFDDTLSAVADKYGTWVEDLVQGNCIKDKNLIVVGQVLRVPGDVQPHSPEVACVPWQVLTPINGAVTVPADGNITFNWIGPAAPINLIRIWRPDGSKYEVVIELRQNESVDLNDYLSEAGTYTWYVYPLGRDFQQIQCLEGGPWTFTKPESSTPTPTVVASSGGGGGSGS
jgi:LysM repeat protein